MNLRVYDVRGATRADEERKMSNALKLMLQTNEGKFCIDVLEELLRARTKFPDSVCCTVALMEEVGELAQAMLKVSAGKWPESRVREEAVQVAVMAMRCALEGDRSISAMGYVEKENQ